MLLSNGVGKRKDMFFCFVCIKDKFGNKQTIKQSNTLDKFIGLKHYGHPLLSYMVIFFKAQLYKR